MNLDPFEIICLAGAFCGIIMVCGGIMLLRVGAIKLSETADKGSFAVEIRKDIKITTSYPALGIFVIGLLFICVSAYMTKPDKDLPLSILGQLDVAEPSSFKIQVEPDQLSIVDAPDSSGRFEKTLVPRIKQLKVTFTASGYDPNTLVRYIKPSRHNIVQIPDGLKFTKVKANPGSGEIKPVAAGDKLAPPTASGSF